MRRGRWRTIARDAALVGVLAIVCVRSNTPIDAPPRFDGAGYAVLARSLLSGQGYREIDHPDRPRHAHFPPGYPLTLAASWWVTGPSARASHWLSIRCTYVAVVATWFWLRRRYAPRVALVLGLALGVNWAWSRIGGSIQSEPLFLLLCALGLLVTDWVARRGGIGRGLALGLVLGGCSVTRHVGACLAVAVGVELLLRRRWSAVLGAMAGAALVVLPWVAWLASVRHNTQVGLLPGRGLVGVVAGNALFYLRRIPDQITGPVVEVGTVFRPGLRAPVTAWAALGTAVVVLGWVRLLKDSRRRLAALVPMTTLPLLLAWPFTEAGRFLVPLVPFILVGAVEGLSALPLRVRHRRLWAAGLVLAASIPYATYAIVTGRAAAAQRAHADFDAACLWIAQQRDHPGPILTRQPGEAFWLAGRTGLSPPDDPDEIDRWIDRYGIAYLVVDDRRYARAPDSPLGRYVATRPARFAKVWERGTVAVFAVRGSSGVPRGRSVLDPRRAGGVGPLSSAAGSGAPGRALTAGQGADAPRSPRTERPCAFFSPGRPSSPFPGRRQRSRVVAHARPTDQPEARARRPAP